MNIDGKVMNMIRESCAEKECCVTKQTSFADLSIDSLSFVELVVGVEDAFEISFDDSELILSDWKTVGNFIRRIKQKLQEKKE